MPNYRRYLRLSLFFLSVVALCSLGTLVTFSALALSACSGSGDDVSDAELGEFAGVWDVRYNFSTDECVMVEGGITGFVDIHSIDQDDSTGIISMSASIDFGEGLEGAATGTNTFEANQVVNGDIFGDGNFCSVEQSISYEATDAGRATTLFSRHIECSDGYVCESRALGEAVRRE